MRRFREALDTCLDSPLPCQPLSSHGSHFTVFRALDFVSNVPFIAISFKMTLQDSLGVVVQHRGEGLYYYWGQNDYMPKKLF